VASDGERAQVRTQGVPTGRRRPGILLAQLGSDSAAGGPACSALCSHVRPMLLGAGLYGAGLTHAAAGVAACAGPGRAVTGGVHWGVRSVCAGGVRAWPRRGLHCRFSAWLGSSGWPSGAEKAGWVGVCLPVDGGGHRCDVTGSVTLSDRDRGVTVPDRRGFSPEINPV